MHGVRLFQRIMAFPELKRFSTRRAALIALLALAAYLRLRGISFGLPDKYRPDEEYLVAHAVGFQGGDLNPRFFIYPSLSLYMLAAVYWIFGVVGELYGFLDNGVAQYFGENLYGPAHLIGRLMSAFFGVAGVWAVYRLGRELRGRAAGLLSALLAATSFILARESHYATTDMVMTFFFTATLICCLRLFRKRDALSFLLAGIFAGLSVSSKYTAVVLAGPITGAWLCAVLRDAFVRAGTLRPSSKNFLSALDPINSIAKLNLALTAAIVAFFVTSPYVLLDFAQFKRDWQYQLPFLRYGLGIKMDYGWTWVWRFGLNYGLGGVFRAALLAAVFFSVYEACKSRFKKSEPLILSSAILCVCLVLAKSNWVFLRYVAPIAPPACVLLADYLLRVKNSVKPRYAAPILISGVIALAFDPLSRTILHNALLVRPDTRSIANEWIKKNIPRSSKIAVDLRYFYGKPQLSGGYSYVGFDAAAKLSPSETPFALIDSHPITFFSPEPSPAAKALLASRWEAAAEFSPFNPESDEKPIFDVEDAFYVPVAGFGAVTKPGSQITIYKLK